MIKVLKPMLIILGMLIITIGIGGVVGLAFARPGQKNVKLVAFNVPNVETTMRSSADGRKYNVKLDLYLELNSEIVKELSPFVARKQLIRNLEYLDYEIVAADGGMEYVTEQIISWFVDDIERDRDVGNIYVSDMVTGPYKFFALSGDEETYTGEVVMDANTLRTFNALFKASN